MCSLLVDYLGKYAAGLLSLTLAAEVGPHWNFTLVVHLATEWKGAL